MQVILKFEDIMQNKLMLTLYKNDRGAVIGDLYLITTDGDNENLTRLMATTHPATICAAIFAMDAYEFVFRSERGEGEFEFPVATSQLDELANLLVDQDEGKFMSGCATFSRFDFAHPAPFDTQAEIHFRVSAHHLPPELVKIHPAQPVPKSFKKDLKVRNKYIYHPSC